jgi:site-specific recombinase XerD
VKGTRPLTTDEIIAVSNQFDGDFAIRNRSLFMLGVSVGGRISELLALSIKDVWQNGQAVSDLLFEKNVVKGKENARMIPVNDDGRDAISNLVEWHRKRLGGIDVKRPLFISRQQGEALSRSRAHRILESAFQKAGLNGKLATHSLRKTFAQRCYDASDDIYRVGELLGHKNVETTKRYIGISYAKLQETVKAIEINKHRTDEGGQFDVSFSKETPLTFWTDDAFPLHIRDWFCVLSACIIRDFIVANMASYTGEQIRERIGSEKERKL